MGKAKSPKIALIGQSDVAKARFVALLKEDDSVDQSDVWPPRRDPVIHQLGDREAPCLTVVDLPSICQTPEILEWMDDTRISSLSNAEKLTHFITTHPNKDDFGTEVLAIKTAMASDALFYLVDGNRPYRRHLATDLKLLASIPVPKIIIIAYDDTTEQGTDGPPHINSWQTALAQFGLPVLKLDLSDGRHEARLDILDRFKAQIPMLASGIDDYRDSMQHRWKLKIKSAAEIIASLVSKAVNHRVREQASKATGLSTMLAENKDALSHRLRNRLEAELRQMEQDAWRQIMQVFGFTKSLESDSNLAEHFNPMVADLFSEETWKLLGLTTPQLIALTAAAGGATGAAIDASVGGASLLVGSIIGTVGGAITGSAMVWVDPKPLGISISKTTHEIGPVTHPNFRWILLDRCLKLTQAVATRSHASLEVLRVDIGQGHSTLGDTVGLVDRIRLWSSWISPGSATAVVDELVWEILNERSKVRN